VDGSYELGNELPGSIKYLELAASQKKRISMD
jgi:hypothetical protein